MTKILVAEDDKFLSKAYKLKLTKKGYDVRLASNGQEVFDILSEFTPDLIILDIMMPVMDGFAVLEKIGKDEKYVKIPIIMATNLAQSDDVVKAMKLGAVDYIVKTEFSTNDLIAKIEENINKRT